MPVLGQHHRPPESETWAWSSDLIFWGTPKESPALCCKARHCSSSKMLHCFQPWAFAHTQSKTFLQDESSAPREAFSGPQSLEATPCPCRQRMLSTTLYPGAALWDPTRLCPCGGQGSTVPLLLEFTPLTYISEPSISILASIMYCYKEARNDQRTPVAHNNKL